MAVDDGLDEGVPEFLAQGREGCEGARGAGAQGVPDMSDVARPEPLRVGVAVGVSGGVACGCSGGFGERAVWVGEVGEDGDGFGTGVGGEVDVREGGTVEGLRGGFCGYEDYGEVEDLAR